ncbi:hypothetical protein KEM60_01382 [Austwickia sp. TVS 96-490-7B]|nr:hypothetical protein [Austwickia sp. TVS 96-490-7B]
MNAVRRTATVAALALSLTGALIGTAHASEVPATYTQSGSTYTQSKGGTYTQSGGTYTQSRDTYTQSGVTSGGTYTQSLFAPATYTQSFTYTQSNLSALALAGLLG